ncbi:MAG: phosphate acyltransferase PlsX [Chloroflexi bacterium]|nr:phosphate acyltransferase PlsX [Chloroflexota bacterium]|tara:strand:- start:6173 stop:7198 length:1026 start_codon:yes stop_codon:yes gene_type:complete
MNTSNEKDPKNQITIALDAMGGDHGTIENIKGAIEAIENDPTLIIALVGDSNEINEELKKYNYSSHKRIQIIPSKGFIKETESPILALKKNPEASIAVATMIVKTQKADALVSMGSTGASMATAAHILGLVEGFERPALGGPILGIAPQTMLIDLGANVDCRPMQLFTFGIIGSVFAKHFWQIENPRVGLLSVGTEDSKGNRQVKETSALLKNSKLNFIGNIEPTDLPKNIAEVVICDGFVGNIVMKLVESLGHSIPNHLEPLLKSKLPQNDIIEIQKKIYSLNTPAETFGGGPLFGVKGLSIVGHGRAKASAIARAINTAKILVEKKFIDNVNKSLNEIK